MSIEVQRAVAARIRSIREDGGHRRPDLARRAGLSPEYYGRVERGLQNLSLSTLARIAVALGVELADLVVGVDLGALRDADAPPPTGLRRRGAAIRDERAASR